MRLTDLLQPSDVGKYCSASGEEATRHTERVLPVAIEFCRGIPASPEFRRGVLYALALVENLLDQKFTQEWTSDA